MAQRALFFNFVQQSTIANIVVYGKNQKAFIMFDLWLLYFFILLYILTFSMNFRSKQDRSLKFF